jgi:hypothetical protein
MPWSVSVLDQVWGQALALVASVAEGREPGAEVSSFPEVAGSSSHRDWGSVLRLAACQDRARQSVTARGQAWVYLRPDLTFSGLASLHLP